MNTRNELAAVFAAEALSAVGGEAELDEVSTLAVWVRVIGMLSFQNNPLPSLITRSAQTGYITDRKP